MARSRDPHVRGARHRSEAASSRGDAGLYATGGGGCGGAGSPRLGTRLLLRTVRMRHRGIATANGIFPTGTVAMTFSFATSITETASLRPQATYRRLSSGVSAMYQAR